MLSFDSRCRRLRDAEARTKAMLVLNVVAASDLESQVDAMNRKVAERDGDWCVS